MLYDKDIREPLFEYLEEQYGKTRFLEEVCIGKTRTDVIMVTEASLVGIEIKSDADTYARLARQVKDYNRVFDYNIVAVGSRHANSIKEHVPEYWGIITIEEQNGIDFYWYREPKKNPKRERTVMFRNQFSLLWRPEIAHIQEKNNLPKYKNFGKDKVIRKIMEKLPEEILKKDICEALFERDYTTIQETIQQYKMKNIHKNGKNS